MIKVTHGNLLTADVEALVNTVNTVGVMGKGIALQFRQAFPDNYKAYRAACNRGEVVIGRMFVHDTKTMTNPRFIINFPTKQHWKSRSSLEIVEAGLADLEAVIQRLEITSIALPPLGCGHGGLNWSVVWPLIKRTFADLQDVKILVFPPEGAPTAASMPIGSDRPNMTPGRAALVGLLARYIEPGCGVGQVEIQKLLYFLQCAGEPLRLRFVAHNYGPYAEQVNHVLQHVEGHFLVGYGDRTAPEPIRLLPDAQKKADTFLAEHPETLERFARVAELIEGFETPYGLELLATTHWVTAANAEAAEDVDAAVRLVQAWSPRKGRLFTAPHITAAWSRLVSGDWFANPQPTA